MISPCCGELNQGKFNAGLHGWRVTSGEVRCEHRSSYARSSPPLRPLLPRRCYLPPSGDSAQHCATSPTYIATSDTCRGFYTQSALVEGGQHPINREFHRFDGVGEGEPSRYGKREPQPPQIRGGRRPIPAGILVATLHPNPRSSLED